MSYQNENYFNRLALRAQNSRGNTRCMSDAEAKQILALHRSGTKTLYISHKFNVSQDTIRKYIALAELLEKDALKAQQATNDL